MFDATEWKYEYQQLAINEIAAKLGVVAYRPDYHRKERDKNTVLFYLKGDEAHNRKVDREPLHYTSSEARDSGLNPDSKYVYRDPFWTFENSDVNNQLEMNYANYGKVDLRGSCWREVLEGHVRLARARRLQVEHIRSTGGILNLREADSYYNDLNREKLKALKMIHGQLFLGNINLHGDMRGKVLVNGESVYEELLDQKVYNFGCDFAVPTPDKELEDMIRAWNGDDRLPKKIADVKKMTSRIEKLGGINLIWY